MKINLPVVIGLIVTFVTGVISDECRNICSDVNRSLSFKSGCSAFRNSLPKPKVARHCQNGFKAAVDANCYDACINGGRAQSFLAERRLDETCHGAVQEVPRPLCHDSCVQGYRSGLKEMSATLVTRILEAREAAKAETTGLKPSQSTPDNEDGVQAQYDVEREIEYQEVQHLDESTEDSIFATNEVDGLTDKSDPVNDVSADFNIEYLENDIDTATEEDGLVILLPISIDGVQKELAIYESDDPTDTVFAFCMENMKDEVNDCVDHLLGAVRDNLADYADVKTT